MRLTLMSPADDTYEVSVVSLLVPTTNQLCSLCGNRPPCWFVAPAIVSNTPDLGVTPLGGSDACARCLNDLLDHGSLAVVNADPDSF